MVTKRKDYINTIGRRKAAVARVRLYKKSTDALKITINDRDFKEYFNYAEWQHIITSPLTMTAQEKNNFEIKVAGGGTKSQAEAIRHGIARALIEVDKDLRSTLKKAGMLTRDARIKERKKPGLKKARRAPQWSKR